MTRQADHFFEFGPFRLNPQERLLLRDGVTVPLTPKAFDTLLMLTQNSGHMLEKGELLKGVWPDTFVEEATLAQNIFLLRKALGDDKNGNRYIETVPKRGYRFVATVREVDRESVIPEAEKVAGPANITAEKQVEIGGKAHQGFEQERLGTNNAKPTGVKRWLKPTTLLAVCVLLVGLPVGLVYFRIYNKSKAAEKIIAIKSMAVLPFKTSGKVGDDEHLGLGMADALITRLGRTRQIVLSPTSAVSKYTVAGQDPLIAGRELGVDAVLDGNILRSDNRIRVTLQLLRVTDGAQLWAEKFDQEYQGLPLLQDSIAEKVAGALALKLTPDDRERLKKRDTESPQAYEAYLLGRYFFDRGGAANDKKAFKYYREAINLDPNFACAYAGLADIYSVELGYSESLNTRILAHNAVEAAARKALEIDDTLAEAHTALGRLRFYDWDWAGAEMEFKRAIELDPNFATAHTLYAWYLVTQGRVDEGIAEEYRALALDPLSVKINTSLGAYLTFAGQNDRAIEQLRKAIDLSPTPDWSTIRLAQAYEMKGMCEESIAEFQKGINLAGNSGAQGIGMGEIRLGQTYAFCGRRAEAMKIIAKWKASSPPNTTAYDAALIYIGLGERDRAFKLLEKVYDNHDMNLLSLRTDPRLGSFRSDPRYSNLMRRIHLAPSEW